VLKTRRACICDGVFRYDEACVEETKGLLGGLFKYCKKKFTADQVSQSLPPRPCPVPVARCNEKQLPPLTVSHRVFTQPRTL
jgi:hypothetical protein